MDGDLQILVVEDHILVQDGLCLILQDLTSDTNIFRANDCQSAQDIAENNPKISLILLDISLPDCDGLYCLVTIKALLPHVPVVVVSGDDRQTTIRQCIDHGASGFIPKSEKKDIFLGALRLVLAGGIYIPTSVLQDSNRISTSSQKYTRSNIDLTKRQNEVLVLLSNGKSNKAIARALGAAESTIRAHVTAILRALGASNRTEAVINARREGLLADLGS